MSAFQFYKTLGQSQVTPKHRDISSAATNVVVWTPTTSTRIAVTNLTISSNLGGTIALFFGGANQIKLAEFFMVGSTSFSPVISSWESTAQDAPLYAVVSQSGPNGWKVTAEGFELDL